VRIVAVRLLTTTTIPESSVLLAGGSASLGLEHPRTALGEFLDEFLGPNDGAVFGVDLRAGTSWGYSKRDWASAMTANDLTDRVYLSSQVFAFSWASRAETSC
jgi:hypothetical protein